MSLTATYQFASFKPHKWEDIENFFRTLWGGKHSNMLKLVKHIRASGLAGRLYAVTSLDSLIITIYDAMDRHKEALHIKYDLNSNEWHFKYFAKPFQDPEFVRTYPSDKGIEKFDKFIQMVRW